jgi:beta-aspartyl-dipeptidase (metallo-type)
MNRTSHVSPCPPLAHSVARSLAQVEALNSEGLTAFFYTGGYRMPPPTITGSVMRDVAFIKTCVGVGEIAIADHR